MTYKTRDLLKCARMSAALVFFLMAALLATGLIGSGTIGFFN